MRFFLARPALPADICPAPTESGRNVLKLMAQAIAKARESGVG
jgi:hypothetical protein